VLAVVALGALLYWLHARQFEETDDAQIDANLSPIGTRVDGTILKVYVDNNQVVHVGDPLVDLDPSDNKVRLDQAQAQLGQAQSGLLEERPSVRSLKCKTRRTSSLPTPSGVRSGCGCRG